MALRVPIPRDHRLYHLDWSAWKGHDPATLVFVVREGRVLLIRKKRGLGAGKINGPGGRCEPGETACACALRETEEELGIRPRDLVLLGDNRFQFYDGYSIHVFIFRAGSFDGEPRETDEAIPLWVPEAEIPYDEMWEDDPLWIPLVLQQRTFAGRFLFDGEVMVDGAVEVDVDLSGLDDAVPPRLQ